MKASQFLVIFTQALLLQTFLPNLSLAYEINPLKLTFELSKSLEYTDTKTLWADKSAAVDVIRAAQSLGLPYEIKNQEVLIKSVGIALYRKKPIDFNEEHQNRLAQFYIFLNRHSAPLKGISWDDDYNIINNLAVNLPPISPDSEAYELLKEYALTDYGALTLKKILEDSNDAIKKKYIQENGTITSLGKEALQAGLWQGHFIFGATDLAISAGSNSLRLPSTFRESFFPVGSEPVDSLALLHHEMGHTRFGLNNKNEDHLQIERITVQRYENPVRTLNSLYYNRTSFEERTIYFDNFNTIHVPSGLVFHGPAYVQKGFVVPSAYLYKHQVHEGQIHIIRDRSGKGIVDFKKEAHFYKMLPPSLPF